MEHYGFVCLREVRGRSGRVWTPGEIWQNADGSTPDDNYLPGGDSFWQMRRIIDERPDDQAALPYTPSGRSQVNWGGPQHPPMPGPVVGERDLLHGGSQEVDMEATRNQSQRYFDAVRGWVPTPSQAEVDRRRLSYLRTFAPAEYSAIIEQYPEMAGRADAPPEAPVLQPIQPAQEPESAPAAAPGELDDLLAAEDAAQREGNEARLAEIRARVAVLLK